MRVEWSALRRVLCLYGAFALLSGGRPGPTLCPFRRISGRRCPACGLTGAVAQALRGRPRRALALHRLGPVTAATVLAAIVCEAVQRPDGGAAGPR